MGHPAVPATARFILVALAVLAALYALACTWMFLRQRQLLYFPQHTRVPTEQTDFALQRPDAVLRGWQLRTHARDPILYFGGNAESVQHARHAFAVCCGTRPLYLPAYRGYGASDGEPARDALLADALALHDEVARRHPGQRISVVGRSLGSGIAAHVASQRPIDRLVLVTPYDRMRHLARLHMPWLPVRWLLREDYDSAGWLHDARMPILVIRAEHDHVVPAASTDALLHALPKAQLTEVTVPGSDHDSVSEHPVWHAALSEFLR
ncbi:alpha/beta hydrolase [Luteimonas sp. e5]